jgi:DNA-binding NtrC family response regulator
MTTLTRTDLGNLKNEMPRVHFATRRVMVIGPIDNRDELKAIFEIQGWDVISGKTNKEARKLAVKHTASLTILADKNQPETGWLSCTKLTKAIHKAKVIIVGDTTNVDSGKFAQFAGAKAFLCDGLGVEEMAQTILDSVKHLPQQTVA